MFEQPVTNTITIEYGFFEGRFLVAERCVEREKE